MTLYEFNALADTEKYETIWEHGVMVGHKVENESKVILYQVFAFYVELYYNPGLNEVQKLRSFSSTNNLDRYMAQVFNTKISYLL